MSWKKNRLWRLRTKIVCFGSGRKKSYVFCWEGKKVCLGRKTMIERVYKAITSSLMPGNNLFKKKGQQFYSRASTLYFKNCYTNRLLCSTCPRLCSKLLRYSRQNIPWMLWFTATHSEYWCSSYAVNLEGKGLTRPFSVCEGSEFWEGWTSCFSQV